MRTFLCTSVFILMATGMFAQFTISPSDSISETITSNTPGRAIFTFNNTSDSTEIFCLMLCSDDMPDDWIKTIELDGLHYIVDVHITDSDTVCGDTIPSGGTGQLLVEVIPNGFLGSGCIQFLVWQENTSFMEKITYCLNFNELVDVSEELEQDQLQVYFKRDQEAVTLVNCIGFEARVLGLDGRQIATRKIRTSQELIPLKVETHKVLVVELVKGDEKITRKLSTLSY